MDRGLSYLSGDDAGEDRATNGYMSEFSASDNNYDYDSSRDAALRHEETQSLSSSCKEYHHENGRRYHSYRAGVYCLPNDEREQERLDLMHMMFYLAMDSKYFFAPITSDPIKVLDVGTGTGIWAVELADLFPQYEIVGVDLSPIQPEWIPPNLSFEVDDIEDKWLWDHPFDFIHVRTIAGSLADWPKFLRQSYDNLNPGGYIEFQEHAFQFLTDDNSLPDDSPLLRVQRIFNHAAEKNNRPFDIAHNLKPWLEQAGFVEVEEEIINIPCGTWAVKDCDDEKEKKKKQMIGTLSRNSLNDGIDAYCKALFTRVLGWESTRLEVLMASFRNALRDPSVHAYFELYVVYGQRPS